MISNATAAMAIR